MYPLHARLIAMTEALGHAIVQAVSKLFAFLPFSCLDATFMQQALVSLLLLAPLTAVMGVQVVNLRMAFFSDAISHSAFAGVALGLILSLPPELSMPAFGLIIGLGIVAFLRHSTLSSDTVIGVFFSGAVAFGLAAISRYPEFSYSLNQFLYGDILAISETEVFWLAILLLCQIIFQLYGWNKLLYLSVSGLLAKVHRVHTAVWQYVFAAFLAAVVLFSVRAVGVLLVTALLIVPAAAARNLAKSAGSMFWWAIGVSVVSSVTGLILSAQDWMRTATGATIILVACFLFAISALSVFTKGVRRI